MKARLQQLTGVLADSGSLTLTGSLLATQGFTGSLLGTASYALTASYSANVVSSSYAETASYSRNLQISGSINNVDFINFNTSASNIQPIPGKLSWNEVDGTLDLGLKGGNVTLQIGQEEVLRVVNKTAANLLESNYNVVRVRSVAEGGAQGQRLAVVLAQGNNDPNSATTLGVVTENINVNEEGFITTGGKVRKINTTGTLQGETWVDGDMLFLSPTTPGRLTNIKPQAPNHTVIIGYVVYAHSNQGIIFVKVDNGYEIDELHNVLINTGSLNSGELLVRSGSVWSNSRQLTGSYGLTGSLTATSFIGSLSGTSSFASTASFAPLYLPLAGGTINGNVTLNGTASIAYLNVTYQSSSIIYSSGSNQFGDATNDTQTLIGRVIVSGSLEVTGSARIPSITGSLLGTASFANNALSSSYALTASYLDSYVPPFPFTGSAQITGSLGVTGSISILGNSNFTAISTGSFVTLKTGTRELQFGSRATFTSDQNSVNNVSIIQASNGNISSSLKINPYGGDVHIGSRNSRVIIGNVTDTLIDSPPVIIAGGDGGYTVPALVVSGQGTTSGLRFWAYGNDGQYFNSMIRGVGDNILFRQQLIQIGNASPSAFLTSFSTEARLEINVAHRTMSNSSTQNQNNSYYQRISYYKGTGADAFSYMMIGSHIASGMGMQMKVSPDAVNFTNGTITINPYGGNVGIGISTAPNSSLHIKGESDTMGSVFRAENLSGTAILVISNNGTGSYNGFLTVTGSLLGTASFANNALSSSFAGISLTTLSSSFATTASFANNFNIRNSLTASGLIYPTVDGLYGQSIQTDGSGSLFFEDTHTIYEHIVAGENLFKADPLYISGSSISGRPIAYKAEALDPAKMPAVLVADQNITQGNEGRGVVLGLIEGINLSAYDDGDDIYVGGDGTWTNVRPTGNNIVQLLGVVTKAGIDGKALILNPGPFNLPNLPSGYTWVGNQDDYPVAASTASIQNVVSSSFALTASFATRALSASFATSASFAPSTPAFPFTGSAQITGSLGVTGSISIRGGLTGSALITQNSSGSIGLVVGNSGSHAFNTTIDNNFNLKVQGEQGLLYTNAAGTRYIRFRTNDSGVEPLDIRTNNNASNSPQMFIRNASGNINLKLASAAGAGYYLTLGTSLAASEFAYLENGLRNFGALQVQGANNISTSGHNDYAAVGIIAVGNIIGFGIKQSALSIQSTHTDSSITANYSLLRLHNNTTFTFNSGGNTVRGIDMDYVINQTGGTTSFIGIDYNPVMTSITGAHYGLLIRPLGTLNGIGHTTNLPTATWHVKGNSDSLGTIFRAENLSNNASLLFDNNGILTLNSLGGGSNYDSFYINTGASGAYQFRVISGIRVLNLNVNFGSNAINGITSTSNANLGMYSDTIVLGKTSTNNPNQVLVGWDIGGFNNVYTKTDNVNSNMLSIRGSHSITSGAGSITNLEIAPTINQTGGSGSIIGIQYNPTLTAITGSHFGILVRPSTLNGFGLGNTLPSASLHIRGGSTGSLLRLESNTSSSIFIIENNGSGSFNGFLTVTGSLLGTASFANNALSSSFASTASISTNSSFALSSSYALTASYALNGGGGGVAFPFSGSAQITGSLGITGSLSVTQNITGSRLFLSSSNGTVSGSTLTVYGSGSAQPVFTVQGSQGELFSITDSLTGSLFSVNDISGLPILEVFSDNTTLIGNYQDPMLITTAKVVQTNSGSFTVYNLPTASYDTAFFEYSVRSGSNARAGNIMAIQSGSLVNFTETTTTDFGNTSAISFTVIVSGSNIALTGSSTTGSWTIKAIVKGI